MTIWSFYAVQNSDGKILKRGETSSEDDADIQNCPEDTTLVITEGAMLFHPRTHVYDFETDDFVEI